MILGRNIKITIRPSDLPPGAIGCAIYSGVGGYYRPLLRAKPGVHCRLRPRRRWHPTAMTPIGAGQFVNDGPLVFTLTEDADAG